MKMKYIHKLCIILIVALGVTSCLKDNDNDNVILYGDTAITSFSLNTVKRTIKTTTSKGADTTYVTTLTSSTDELPDFTIDQYKRLIYNTEPLPSGCDLKHVLVGITSTNSGQVTIKSLISDTLFYYNSTDSIDFTQSRIFRVIAGDNSSYRDYTVTVNMSESDSDKLKWALVAAGEEGIPATLYNDILLNAGEAGTFSMSKDNGNTWTEERIGEDEDASLLPTADIAWVTFPYSSNKDTDYELMAGTTDTYSNGYVLWRKIVDHGKGAAPAVWVFMTRESNRLFQLPKMNSLSLVWYDGGLYAFGDEGKIYKTTDQGITWKTTDDIKLPTELKSYHIKVATGTSGELWIRDIDNDELWKGTR